MLLKKDRKELVSVVLPVYNAEKYISASVESVLRQTHKNIELIIINDGSTDNTKAKLDAFRKCQNVSIIERANKGLVATLNEGVHRSDGRYIMRMDADDINLPKRIEHQLSFMKSNELDIVGSAIKTFGGFYSYTRRYFEDDARMKFQLLFASCFAHPTILCKKEVLLNNPYDDKYEKIEDYDLWTRLAAANYKMGNCNEVLLMYRVHKKQITSKNRAYQDGKRIEIAKRYCRQYFSNESFADAMDNLLSREFKVFDEKAIRGLSDFYSHLGSGFKTYNDIINHQYFLCFLHNHFGRSGLLYLTEFSFLKRSLLLAFNSSPYIKKIPMLAYRKLTE